MLGAKRGVTKAITVQEFCDAFLSQESREALKAEGPRGGHNFRGLAGQARAFTTRVLGSKGLMPDSPLPHNRLNQLLDRNPIPCVRRGVVVKLARSIEHKGRDVEVVRAENRGRIRGERTRRKHASQQAAVRTVRAGAAGAQQRRRAAPTAEEQTPDPTQEPTPPTPPTPAAEIGAPPAEPVRRPARRILKGPSQEDYDAFLRDAIWEVFAAANTAMLSTDGQRSHWRPIVHAAVGTALASTQIEEGIITVKTAEAIAEAISSQSSIQNTSLSPAQGKRAAKAARKETITRKGEQKKVIVEAAEPAASSPAPEPEVVASQLAAQRPETESEALADETADAAHADAPTWANVIEDLRVELVKVGLRKMRTATGPKQAGFKRRVASRMRELGGWVEERELALTGPFANDVEDSNDLAALQAIDPVTELQIQRAVSRVLARALSNGDQE